MYTLNSTLSSKLLFAMCPSLKLAAGTSKSWQFCLLKFRVNKAKEAGQVATGSKYVSPIQINGKWNPVYHYSLNCIASVTKTQQHSRCVQISADVKFL